MSGERKRKRAREYKDDDLGIFWGGGAVMSAYNEDETMTLSLDADLAKSNISQRSSIHDDDDGGRGISFGVVRDVRGAQSRGLSVYWRGEACGERPARGRGW